MIIQSRTIVSRYEPSNSQCLTALSRCLTVDVSVVGSEFLVRRISIEKLDLALDDQHRVACRLLFTSMRVAMFVMAIGQLEESEPLTSRRSVAVTPHWICPKRSKKTPEKAMQSREWRIRQSTRKTSGWMAIGLKQSRASALSSKFRLVSCGW